MLVSLPLDATLRPPRHVNGMARRDRLKEGWQVEFMCPVCGKWTEIHEYQVIAGSQCKCPRCWALLRVESVRPFRIQVEGAIKKPAVRIGSGVSKKGKQRG